MIDNLRGHQTDAGQERGDGSYPGGLTFMARILGSINRKREPHKSSGNRLPVSFPMALLVMRGEVLHLVATEADRTFALGRLAEAVRDPEGFQYPGGIILHRKSALSLGAGICRSLTSIECASLPMRFAYSFTWMVRRYFVRQLPLGVPLRAGSLQFCLSKNLAAPVVVGGATFIQDDPRL